MNDLFLLLLLAALSYLLGELRCHKRVIHYQKNAIRAQDKAIETCKRAESVLQKGIWTDSNSSGA